MKHAGSENCRARKREQRSQKPAPSGEVCAVPMRGVREGAIRFVEEEVVDTWAEVVRERAFVQRMSEGRFPDAINRYALGSGRLFEHPAGENASHSHRQNDQVWQDQGDGRDGQPSPFGRGVCRDSIALTQMRKQLRSPFDAIDDLRKHVVKVAVFQLVRGNLPNEIHHCREAPDAEVVVVERLVGQS